jgi:hypothetical protein
MDSTEPRRRGRPSASSRPRTSPRPDSPKRYPWVFVVRPWGAAGSRRVEWLWTLNVLRVLVGPVASVSWGGGVGRRGVQLRNWTSPTSSGRSQRPSRACSREMSPAAGGASVAGARSRGRDCVARFRGEACADVAGVAQHALAVVDGEQNRADQAGAAAFAGLPADRDDFLGERDRAFDPVGSAAAGLVGGRLRVQTRPSRPRSIAAVYASAGSGSGSAGWPSSARRAG